MNGLDPESTSKRFNFEDMTPVFPNEKIHLERPGAPVSMRIMDLISPIGKGQRGMIVSQPKAGKTTLLKDVAKSVKLNHPDMHMIILLIDERPEKEEISIPDSEREQKMLLRGLFNVRLPADISDEFLEFQDEDLKGEMK